jgi:hypothetical protein
MSAYAELAPRAAEILRALRLPHSPLEPVVSRR